MGKRSATESVIGILSAFIEERTWSQKALADRLGITSAQVRKHLEALSAWLPFAEPDRDDPPHVYWSLPARWFPAGIVVGCDDADELMRHLARAPESDRRNALLLTLAQATPRALRPTAPAEPERIAACAMIEAHELHLRTLEDACQTRTSAVMSYHTASRGDRAEQRWISVQRVLIGPLTRFVAHCHQRGSLRFFRLSRINAIRLDPATPYVATPPAELDAFLAGAVSGYRDPGDAVRVSFVVDNPEARWVRDTLPLPMDIEPLPAGLRFTATTSGIVALARFVVGLGAAAHVETPELLAAVHALAQGSLGANTPSIRSVAPIRSTGSSSSTG